VNGAPDFTAAIDQAQAEVRDKAKVVAAYWKSLTEEGVDDWDATRLTLAFQRRFLFPEQQADATHGDDD
jgi:hypothetical protein